MPPSSTNERRATPRANPSPPVYRSIARPVAYNSNAPCNYYYATPAQVTTPPYYTSQPAATANYYPYTVNYQVPAPAPAKPVQPTVPNYAPQNSTPPTQRLNKVVSPPVYHVAPNSGASIARQVLSDHAPGFKQSTTTPKQSPTPPQVTNKTPDFSNHKLIPAPSVQNYGSFNFNTRAPVYAATHQSYCAPSWPTTWPPVHQTNYGGLTSYSPPPAWPNLNYSNNCVPHLNSGFGWNTRSSLLGPFKPKRDCALRGLSGRFQAWRACRRLRRASRLNYNSTAGYCC